MPLLKICAYQSLAFNRVLVNYSLSKREKYQPFIHLDNDTLITDPDWIKKFQNTALIFNDLGLIGAVTKDYFNNYLNIKEDNST